VLTLPPQYSQDLGGAKPARITGSAATASTSTSAVSAATAVAAAAATADKAAKTDWWTHFKDPELDRLVGNALARNNNLAAAAIRVRRAQLQAGLADESLTPKLSGSLSTGVSRALESGAGNTRSNSTSLGVSYEIDLWNKLGSQRDVARWEALATEQDLQSAALALVGTTARLYWQLAFLNQRLTASNDSIAYAETTFALVQRQYRAGAVSGLEVADAQQALASQQASRNALQQQAVEARTALSLLFDAAPGNAPSQPQVLPTLTLPTLQADVPAALLGRRPDLRAAELRLREAFSNIDATRASYYPALSLTGALGTSSTQLANVLQNPVATLGLGISLPFLQRETMQLSIRVSQAQYEEAVRSFRQTLYTALGEVDNALSSRQQLGQQAARLEETLQAARTAERLNEVRYRAGAGTLKLWLDAQEKRRNADIALAENRLARLNSQLALYQALGGDTAAAP
jgi:NodT family efflux transporter outer membrane factor (OMF) lipoprotein